MILILLLCTPTLSTKNDMVHFSLLSDDPSKPEQGLAIVTVMNSSFMRSGLICSGGSFNNQIICRDMSMAMDNVKITKLNDSVFNNGLLNNIKCPKNALSVEECSYTIQHTTCNNEFLYISCTKCNTTECFDLDTNTCVKQVGTKDERGRCIRCELGYEEDPVYSRSYPCLCNVGHFWNGTSSTCMKCPPNTFKNADISYAPMCRKCPTGTYSEPGSSICKCRDGSYFSVTNFVEVAGQNGNVTSCNQGITNVGGKCVRCADNQAGDGVRCHDCPSGYFGVGSKCKYDGLPITLAFVCIFLIAITAAGVVLLLRNRKKNNIPKRTLNRRASKDEVNTMQVIRLRKLNSRTDLGQ